MDFNISSATRGHVTLSNFLDLSESNSRFKVRMQVVTAEAKTRPCKSGCSLDSSPAGDRHSAPCRPCALRPPAPDFWESGLAPNLNSDLGPMQHFCLCCRVQSPEVTYVPPTSWSTANAEQRPRLQPAASRPGRREPEMPALGP